MPKLKPGTIWPTPEEDAAITAAAMSDPDAIPFTDEEWERAVTVHKRPVGRPPVAEPRVNITLRLSRSVVEQFRATGKGWQTRMNDVLQEWIRKRNPSG